jgi:hypothetical protein
MMVGFRESHTLDVTGGMELDDGRYAVPMALFRVCESRESFEHDLVEAYTRLLEGPAAVCPPPPGEERHHEDVKEQLESFVEGGAGTPGSAMTPAKRPKRHTNSGGRVVPRLKAASNYIASSRTLAGSWSAIARYRRPTSASEALARRCGCGG